MVVWTDKMKETLKVLGESGMSYGNIVKYMSATFNTTFTKGSVIGMAHRIDVPRREPPIPPIVKPPVDPRIKIEDLQYGMCKWPLGEHDDRPPYFYCGKPTEDFCSWCEEHKQRAYVRVRVVSSSPVVV